MNKITRPKLAYIANRINGGYTESMGRAISPLIQKEIEKAGYTESEAKQIVISTAALERLMRRAITTSDLLDLSLAGFESILIKAESSFRHELERAKVESKFDNSTNMFTIVN